MPVPALVGGLVSVLGWIGIDLGISHLTEGSVEYVRGLDFPTFIEAYWLPVLLYSAIALASIWFAVPKNDGRGFRPNKP